jgi:hypothetical protein
VAVEKLLSAKFAKIKSRQDALQTIFSSRLDIFYPPNFGCLGLKASFSTATGDYAQNPSMSVIGMLRQRLRGMSTSCSETTSVYSLSSCFKRKPGWSRALWK